MYVRPQPAGEIAPLTFSLPFFYHYYCGGVHRVNNSKEDRVAIGTYYNLIINVAKAWRGILPSQCAVNVYTFKYRSTNISPILW
jgi:hypothetical protein